MFSLAYVLLPFSDMAPADAIRASLARFQRGSRGDLPDDWLAFRDETPWLRAAHEAKFTFTIPAEGGLRTEGGGFAYDYVSHQEVRREMHRRGLQSWSVCFADTMDLDSFQDRFGPNLQRHAVTGAYGIWHNPLGQWDWWDLGGRFDGVIIGDETRRAGRGVARINSGEHRGRTILANVETVFETVLGQEPEPLFDVRSDRNVELVTTLLTDARAGRPNARPGALVLPSGALDDSLRWLDNFPQPGPADAFVWLGISPDANWQEVVEAAYARFEDHWAAGVAYHY
jgi:hypothetical protein